MVQRCLAVLAFAACALLPASAHAAAPGVFFGESPSASQVAEAKEAGAKNMRWFLSWADAEPTDDAFSAGVFDTYAGVAQQAAAEGIRPIVVLMFTPGWANGNAGATAPPSDPAEFAEFAGEAAKRLAGHGVLYEIWNEQDEPKFFAGAPGNVGHYAAMLKGAFAAITANDPTGIVNVGPLTGGNVDYLNALYDQGAKDHFHGISIHLDHEGNQANPYHYYREAAPGVLAEGDRIGRFSFLAFRELWRVARERGDAPADIPALRSFSDGLSSSLDSMFIAITEMGRNAQKWVEQASYEAGHFYPDFRGEADDPELDASGPGEQAKYLKRAFHCANSYPYVKIANWFSYRDIPSAGSYADYGLVGRPALGAFKAGDTMTSTCGDFVKPTITKRPATAGTAADGRPVVALPKGQPLDVVVGATDNRRVKRVAYTFAGKTENFDGAEGERNLQAAKTLPAGDHPLELTAVDVYGNVATEQLVVRVGAAPNGGKTSFGVLSLKRRGSVFTVSFSVGPAAGALRAARAAQAAGLPGKVRIEWAHFETYRKKVGKKRKKVRGYRVLHKATKPATKGKVTASQRLKKKGRWRVRAVYLGSGAYKKSTSKWKTFKR